MRQRETNAPKLLTDKELRMLEVHRERQERYIRTARFVQSKWFMIGGAVAIALFLLLIIWVKWT